MSGRNADTPVDARALAKAVCALSLLATVLFAALVVGYDRAGARLLSQLDLSVGEVLMKEGQRLEEAGAIENAKERYTAALATRFGGEQNRAYTLKLLGTLYWSEGAFEKALPYLQQATASERAEATFFEPYCDTLFQLKRFDEATHAIAAWQSAVAKSADREAMSATKFHEGRLALAQGRRGEAKRAFEEGTALAPGGRNASELALLAFEDGDLDTALKQVDACLATGPTAARAAQMTSLRKKILTLIEKTLIVDIQPVGG